MAVMGLLLMRIICFIVKVMLAIRKMLSSNTPPLKPFHPGPEVYRQSDPTGVRQK